MSSLIAVSTRKPFEPPRPTLVSPLVIAGGMALLALAVVIDRLSGGLLGTLLLIPTPSGKPAPAPDAKLAGTTGPASDSRGNARCTRCGQFVAYSSMSLDEDGYFCPPCAAAIVAAAE